MNKLKEIKPSVTVRIYKEPSHLTNWPYNSGVQRMRQESVRAGLRKFLPVSNAFRRMK